MVLGYGCGSLGMTGRNRYPGEAYQLGRSLQMKKVLILSASPRKKGNSDILCQQFKKGC